MENGPLESNLGLQRFRNRRQEIMSRTGAGTDPWYQRAFRSEYLQVYPGRSVESAEAEVAAALDWLSPEEGARVLDLCCGAGRHSRWLQESAIELHGLDLSEELLAEARRHLQESVILHQGDMRQLPFEVGHFDAVLMFFTSFGYFETDEENQGVLKEVARVVREGGRFLLDLPDRDLIVKKLVPVSEKVVGDKSILEERSITTDGKRVEKRVTLTGPVGESHYIESVRLFTKSEVTKMLEESGWALLGCRGDWDGSDQIPGISPRMIFTAERSALHE